LRLTKLMSSMISPNMKGFSMVVITLISVTLNGVTGKWIAWLADGSKTRRH
jgi:hypothetical protein